MRSSATIELIGYVGGQPENPMADKYPNFISFSLSVNRRWKDKDGQEKEECTWYKCQSWSEGLSKMIGKNVKGGMGLIIKGTPKSKAYIDKEGIPKSQIEVIIQDINILTFPKDEETSLTSSIMINAVADSGKFKLAPEKAFAEVRDLPDDEIPF